MYVPCKDFPYDSTCIYRNGGGGGIFRRDRQKADIGKLYQKSSTMLPIALLELS